MIIDQLPSANPNLTDETVTEQGTNLFKTTWQKIRDLFFGSSASFASDVTVGGALDVVPRRCSATLSSAGWYRVLHYAASSANDASGYKGAILHLDVTRGYTNAANEAHGIDLDLVYGKIAFIGEKSVSNSQLIDKVRYNTNGADGYVDIHYTGASANPVTVCFCVAADATEQAKFTAESLQAVADAPAGETVLTTYSFAANTELSEDATENGVRHVIRRTGKIVILTLDSSGGVYCPAGQYTTVNTLPDWAKPSSTVYTIVDAYGGNNIISGMITGNGNVQLYPVLSSTDYYRLTITYYAE